MPLQETFPGRITSSQEGALDRRLRPALGVLCFAGALLRIYAFHFITDVGRVEQIETRQSLYYI